MYLCGRYNHIDTTIWQVEPYIYSFVNNICLY